jgi:hypothetical protein
MLRRTPTPVAADNRSVVDALLKRERAFGQVKASAPMRVAAILTLLVLCLTNTSSARVDSASCLAKAASFVTELDELLEKEQYSMSPHHDLMKEYFPLRDCEAEALLDVVRSSRFIRSISYFPRRNEYFIRFERDNLRASFGYFVAERKSELAGAGWINKP